MRLSQSKSNEIPREEIPWFPRIEPERCTGCGVCISFCQYKVYRESDGKAEVANPYACLVGCSGCVSQCPSQAISFPSLIELRETLKTLRAKHGQETK